jgi:hypothetical protein
LDDGHLWGIDVQTKYKLALYNGGKRINEDLQAIRGCQAGALHRPWPS